MSTLDSIAAGSAVGSMLPLLTAVVQRPQWSVRAKKIVAVVTALIAGVVTVAYVDGPEQFQHGLPTLATLAAVLAASQSAYDLVWKPTSIAPVIESATSPKEAPTA
ncbi:hypothetical protein OHS33_38630 (plasmid) [Streptomyces sp. NBC_00536]|uniref:hypothetical protein n=1 Tax=Streptomyces sp. NBC_00536 TaxID=2975769 RepID=UPI002E80C9E7|nr:hypothetical protein [Streptomyces sp. NBC_00536]WUC84419.1 hypothetical protein OHS33_38630 [Streptomyces sp. NBC_00536]